MFVRTLAAATAAASLAVAPVAAEAATAPIERASPAATDVSAMAGDFAKVGIIVALAGIGMAILLLTDDDDNDVPVSP